MRVPKGKFCWSVKVGDKGQIVIPKKAREVFDIKPNDTIVLFGDIKRGIAIPPRKIMEKFIDVAFGEEEEE